MKLGRPTANSTLADAQEDIGAGLDRVSGRLGQLNAT
jgi:hypothetical protein